MEGRRKVKPHRCYWWYIINQFHYSNNRVVLGSKTSPWHYIVQQILQVQYLRFTPRAALRYHVYNLQFHCMMRCLTAVKRSCQSPDKISQFPLSNLGYNTSETDIYGHLHYTYICIIVKRKL